MCPMLTSIAIFPKVVYKVLAKENNHGSVGHIAGVKPDRDPPML